MAHYSRWPHCGNDEEGTKIFKCEDCGAVGCFKDAFFDASGCMDDRKCYSCGSYDVDKLGKIEDD